MSLSAQTLQPQNTGLSALLSLFSVVALPTYHYTVVTLKHCNYSPQVKLQLNKKHRSNGQVSQWHFPLYCVSWESAEGGGNEEPRDTDILVALSESESAINPLQLKIWPCFSQETKQKKGYTKSV